MSKTVYKTYDGTSMYAQVFERNRDMGSEAYPLTDVDGQYKIQLVFDEDMKKRMIADGIPDVILGNEMFKETEDGLYGYTFKRTHLHKRFTNDDGTPQVNGSPNVVDWKASQENKVAVPWDNEQNIWNGSKVKVKVSIYKGRVNIVTLESVGVVEAAEAPERDEALVW